MNNTGKNIIYSLVLLMVIALVYLYREAQRPVQVQIQGETMGTYYKIIYLDAQSRRLQKSIDSLLLTFNQSLSTYIENSEISRFNRQSSWQYNSPYFFPVLEKSAEIHKITEGAFDPTVMPLVNAWGFSKTPDKLPDSLRIDSLRQMVGFEKITFDKKQVKKPSPSIELDFSAIAKGYGVDIVAKFLESKGIKNYLVEIGGEVVAKGKNEKGDIWRLGINKPEKSSDYNEIFASVQLENRAMATSGNYRNYFKVGNTIYAHTLNPKTGYPVQHNLISASVFAPDCMTADAYATAFMVLGLEKTKSIAESQKDIDVFLIYLDENGEMKSYASKGIASAVNQ